ncbi:MAG: hypothetical protein LC105_06205 [Chitinophagales bacterium]|nr:hypothetical protein [Chitinophagales bacterium]
MAHKKIDFTQLGGFPSTQNTFDFMQNAYNDAIAGLARAVGEKVIVSGVEENNSQVTDGWVVINGELLPFKGGAIQSHVVIVETSKSVVFDNPATSKEVYFDRVVKFGSGPGQIPWSDFKRVKTMQTHQEDDNPHNLPIPVCGGYVDINGNIEKKLKNGKDFSVFVNNTGYTITHNVGGLPIIVATPSSSEKLSPSMLFTLNENSIKLAFYNTIGVVVNTPFSFILFETEI